LNTTSNDLFVSAKRWASLEHKLVSYVKHRKVETKFDMEICMIRSTLSLKRIFVGFICTVMLASSFFGVISHASAAGTTRYVATSGTDAGNCGSAGTPCRTIQYAVNQSVSGDIILVAQGTHTYSAGPDFCSFLQTRAVVCIVDKSLTILGGYSTSNWSTSNPSGNLTVIDGQNARRGVAVIRSQTTTYLDIEGFTIQNARAQGPTYVSPYDPAGIGGGMWVQRASVTLRDLVFKNNKSIGANTASGAGGAADGAGLRIESSIAGTSSLLQRVTFNGNQSLGGVGPERGGLAFGALFVFGSTVTIEDSTFVNNLAQAGSSTGNGTTSDGLNAEALGGGIGLGQSSALLNRIVATNNQVIAGNAGTNAGNAFGGAIYSENGSSFVINDSTITGNTAQAGNAATGGTAGGGGILTYNTPATIDRVSLIANTATSGNATGGGSTGSSAGGGLYLWRDNPAVNGNSSVTNTIVADNFVTLGSGTVPGGGGGGITVQGLTATISHTTIARNRLGPSLVSGEGLLVLAAPGGALSATANLNYSIVANHTVGGANAAAILVQAGNTINFNRGLFSGNTIDKSILGSQSGQASMLSAASAGFVSPGSPDFNYHLQSNSAAKDQATGSTINIDIDSQIRPNNGVSDLGADEYWSTVQVLDSESTGVFRPSNGLLYLKNSNTTGFADIAINYGLPGDYPVVGDWDGNGTATIGIYRNGSFYLRNSNTIGFADIVFSFGTPGDQPVAGDWDGNGTDTIGVYRNGVFFLRNSNSAGAPDTSFGLGNPGDVGIAGDWNADGKDTTGVFRPSNGIIFLKNANTTGFADIALNYGIPGDKPVTGDWNNDGVDTIGVYRNGTFLLRNSNTVGFADIAFALGIPGDMPIAGNWDAKP
jgi:hypothetical protein